ncbi:tail fiber domain-containing protein [Paradesertivirga mongoliensis]|uniref:Tail fiber domain-containing protein n=1 Tax=Paradesertivirga mongoliensis TaxID=2100740 RepID=A0ABW4ZPE5_9SPHI|nr:tail fiber domain-containing protein [Pedobacter mongoliensis]
MLKKYFIFKGFALLFLALLCQVGYAQNVGINSTGAAPHESAGLDVSFDTKGFLAPRMTLAQKLAISSPATGLLIYQTDGTAGFYYYNGTTWVFNGSSSQWTTTGSDLYYTGKVGIGSSSAPGYALTIGATANPLYLSGVQEGSGLDSILLIAGGVVKKRVYTATASTNAWSLTGNSGQTNTYNSGSFVGTTDANALRFRTNNVQRMFMDASGNVAIGSNPSFATANEKFLVDAGTTSSYNVISGKGTINNYLQLNIQNLSNGIAASSDIVASNNSGTETTNFVDLGINSTGNTSTDALGGGGNSYLYNKSGNLTIGTATVDKNLRFITGGQATSNIRMKIDSIGNVGIGTGNDDVSESRLNINGGSITNNVNSGLGTVLWVEAERDQYIEMNIQNTSSGQDASADIVATADNGEDDFGYIDMGINSSGYRTGTQGSRILNGPNKAYLYAVGAEMYVGNAAADKPLIFFTNSGSQADEDAKGSERMRITDDGEVLIGYTTDQGDYKLQVNGDIKIDDISYDQVLGSSDRRLKTNISNLKYGLNDIMQLQPVIYNWKKKPDSDKLLGLIAQDVRPLIPEVVKGDESKETLGIDYVGLIPVLINAIKEQQKQIDELKQQVQKLQK